MDTRLKARRSMSRRALGIGVTCLALLELVPAPVTAQPGGATGVIAGSVTADQMAVTAFRVKARDTAQRIAYTVYTVGGRYQIFNLPPGTYQVQVIEGGFEPLVETVDVASGQTTTLNLALTATGMVAAQGAAARGATALRNYGRRAADDRVAELVDFDTLYPPQSRAGGHAAIVLRVPRTSRVSPAWSQERGGVAAGRRPHVRPGWSRRQHGRRGAAGDPRPGVARGEGKHHPVSDGQFWSELDAARPRAGPTGQGRSRVVAAPSTSSTS